MLTAVKDNVSPSCSVSFEITFVLIKVASSLTVKVFATATGPNSHTSPILLLFKSSCPGLATKGQLSSVSETPSPSVSSQTSPIPLPSESSWPGLTIIGQISSLSKTPSPSVSWQASPSPLPSESSWPGFAIVGHMSSVSIIPSPSKSLWAWDINVVTDVTAELFSKIEIDFLDDTTGKSSDVSSIFWAFSVTS